MAEEISETIINDLNKEEPKLDNLLNSAESSSSGTTTTDPTPKKPPPETSTQKTIRTQVVLSFWVVVLILGIPLWWITTSIYRAPLPLKQMSDWAEGRICKPEFPLLVDVVLGSRDTLWEVEPLLKNVQLALDDAQEGFKATHFRLRLATDTGDGGSVCNAGYDDEDDEDEDDENEGGNKDVQRSSQMGTTAAVLRLLPGSPGSITHEHKLYPSSRVIDLFYASTYNPASSASSATLAKYIAKTLQDVFAEEEQTITYLLEKAAGVNGNSRQSNEVVAADGNENGNENISDLGNGPFDSGSIIQLPDISRKMARIIKYSPTYHLTFSLFTASGTPSSWEIETAISNYLSPLLTEISISNFTVDSQVQFYASFSPTVHPEFNQDLQSWTLKKEDLSNFINSAEWPLTSIKNYPTINFIVYIPSEEHTPLVIPESSSKPNAWLLPQWGGVVILNHHHHRDNPSSTRLEATDLKPAFDIFSAQLLSLLGTPSITSLPVRLDSLTRQRSAQVFLSASSTMGSLSRLVLALPNISIPPSVAISVQKTLKALEKSCIELKHGRFNTALRYGRFAESEAEKAFFERTMVAQVYFPEEHKVAVYLPLLGPVGVPLLMGLIRIAKERIAGWKSMVKVKTS